jgi:hypothetical protein
MRFAGGGREVNSVGDGCVGVPRVMFERKPCLSSNEVMARDD